MQGTIQTIHYDCIIGKWTRIAITFNKIATNEDLTKNTQDEYVVIDGQVASGSPSQNEIVNHDESGLNLKYNPDTKQVSLLDISLFDSEEKVIQLFGEPEEITEIAPGEYYYNYTLEGVTSGDLLVGFYEDRVDFLGYDSILGSYLEINKAFLITLKVLFIRAQEN